MTYCVAITVDEGMVFVSDSRTNAGVDHISTYSKVNLFGVQGERQFIVQTAGNLATSQAVINRLRRDIQENSQINLNTVDRLSEAADYIGEISREHQEKHGGGQTYEASFILGGQIAGRPQKIVMIYPQGNHITTSKATPFLQIGESKYGKPILDRIVQADTPLDTATLCALVSMDSTISSNLTVGPPIDIIVYRKNSFCIENRYHLEEDSEYYRNLRTLWDKRLKEAFLGLPRIQWSKARVRANDGQNQV